MRIHRQLPPNNPLRGRKRYPVTPAEIQSVFREVRDVLSLPANIELKPGTEVGFVKVNVVNAHFADFAWPSVHTTIISQRALNLLSSSHLTGWQTARAVVERNKTDQPLNLYELIVDGAGGRPATVPQFDLIAHCEVCGYTAYRKPNLDRFELDTNCWDGSDLFRFSPPYDGYVFVTQHVVGFLTSSNLDGFGFRTVEDFISDYNR